MWQVKTVKVWAALCPACQRLTTSPRSTWVLQSLDGRGVRHTPFPLACSSGSRDPPQSYFLHVPSSPAWSGGASNVHTCSIYKVCAAERLISCCLELEMSRTLSLSGRLCDVIFIETSHFRENRYQGAVQHWSYYTSAHSTVEQPWCAIICVSGISAW